MKTESNGYFGEFGGRYVAETLRAPLDELESAFSEAVRDDSFLETLAAFQRDFVGRPTPLYYAENASKELGGGRIYVKLEGLANTGAHKINNALGQALLARRIGKKRVIAETGASMASLRRQSAQISVWNAGFTWGK
jgi:tryptophan synthase beta chain